MNIIFIFLISYQVNFNEILNKIKVKYVCMIIKRQTEYQFINF